MKEVYSIRQSAELPVLLRGEPAPILEWMRRTESARIMFYLVVIVIGTGLYGAAMGLWRSPTQAVYTAIKLPLIVLLTTLGNILLNGMLAPLLGLNLQFRQSLQAILMSFTIAAAILGAFAPIALFLLWNSPPLDEATSYTSGFVHSGLKLFHVAAIAFAGIAANLRLWQLLQAMSGSAGKALKILIAWLAGNLLLGSQLGWILRPVIGAPQLPVEFLRSNAFEGNFFETLIASLNRIFS